MPAQPRVWWLGLGPFIVGRGRIRAGMLRRLGGLLPVWRGSSGIETHLNAATAVFAAGAHYAVMPEGGTSGPVDRFAEFRPGAAVIGIRPVSRLFLSSSASAIDASASLALRSSDSQTPGLSSLALRHQHQAPAKS